MEFKYDVTVHCEVRGTQGIPSGRHYSDVIMSSMVSQITASIVCSTVNSGADHRKH